MRKTGNWAPDEWHNETLIWGALWWCNGQIRDPSDDEIGAPWWPDGKIWGPRPLILLKRYNTAPLHSFKLMGPKFKLEKIRCHACWKRIHGGSSISIVPFHAFIFQRLCDDLYQCLILVFSVIYLDSWGMGIYRVGPPSGYLKSFVLSFLFYLLFFFLSILYYFPSLSGPL